MKRDNVNYLAAGLTVLGAFALLFSVLFKITGRSGETDPYHTYYDHVAGLRFGTPVYYEGYRVGQVESVVPEIEAGQTRFRIELTVEKGWPIPEDTVAAITTSGLLSDVFIVLRQGEATGLLTPGDLIEGEEATDVFAALNELAMEIQHLTRTELGPLMQLINERVDGITGSLNDNTPVILDDLRETVSRLKGASQGVERLLDDENVERVDNMLVNFETMSGSAAHLAEELRQTRNELDSALITLRQAVDDNRPDVDRMVDDLAGTIENASERLDAIGYNLDEAARNLNEFARAIRMSPNRLIFSAEDDDVEVEE